MPIAPFQVALWVELLAAGLGGLQGALFAAGPRHRRIDLLGVIVIGLAVCLGGGLLRDIILDLPISFLEVGTVDAVAAGAGAGALVLLAALGVFIPMAGLVCVLVTTFTRLGAVRFGWTFPEQRSLRPRRPGPRKPAHRSFS